MIIRIAFLTVQLLALGVVALQFTDGAVQWVTQEMHTPVFKIHHASPQRKPDGTDKTAVTSGDVIWRRNIFDSVTGPIGQEADQSAAKAVDSFGELQDQRLGHCTQSNIGLFPGSLSIPGYQAPLLALHAMPGARRGRSHICPAT